MSPRKEEAASAKDIFYEIERLETMNRRIGAALITISVVGIAGVICAVLVFAQ